MPTSFFYRSATASAAARIAFIDTSIEHHEAIAADIAPDIEIVLIDDTRDGVAQIAAALAGRRGVEAVHIFSHGGEGLIQLGNGYVTADNVATYGGALARIGAALAPAADILLYGCHVGAGARGQALLLALAQATGADVAASSGLTGATALGGDWLLERRVGVVDAASPFAVAHPGFDGTLAVQFHDGDFDSYNVDSTAATVVDTAGASVQVTFAQTYPEASIGDGLAFADGGLYAYNINTNSGVSLTIDAPSGHTFDLNSLTAYSGSLDPGTTPNLTLTATLANGNVVVISATLPGTSSQLLISNFSQPIDNVTKLVVEADHYVTFNDFDISDVKPLATSDTTPPTLTISSDASTLIAGQTATITFTFSEAPVGFDAGDIVVSGGTLGALSGSGLTRTAVFTPTASTDNGTASITVTAGGYTDAAGNAGGAGASPPLTYDTRPPAAPAAPHLAASSDSGASSSDGVTNVVAPTLTGAAGSAEAGATLRLYDSNGTTELGHTTVNGDGSWQITSSALAQGTHTLTVKATDAAGNVGAASTGLTVKIDTAAPAAPDSPHLAAASDSGSSSTDNVTKIVTPTFSGTAEAGATVTLYDTDGATVVATTNADGSGTWSVASVALADGTHTITAKAIDAAGNASAASPGLGIVIDTSAPAAPGTPILETASDSGMSGSDHLTNVATPVFKGVAEAGATVILLDSDGSTVVGSTVAASDGSWSATSAALAEGAHSITAKAVDLAGNVGAASAGAVVNIDLTAPAAQVSSVSLAHDTGSSATDMVTSQAGQDITVVLSAGLGADERVEVSLDNGMTWRTASAAAGGNTWSLPATLAGADTMQVRVIDAAGNAGAVYTHAYALDTAAPAAPSMPDLDDASDTGASHIDNITGDATPTFNGSAENGASIDLYDGTVKIGSAIATHGLWSITSSALAAGSHDITAVATDAAGNVGPASGALTVQIVAGGPATAVSSLALSVDSGASSNDFVTNTAAQTLSGALDAALTAGEYVEVSVDGGQHWSTASAGGQAWSLPVTLATGANDIKVRVTDAVGNSGPVHTQGYVLDTVAPTVSITSDVAQLKAGESATITFAFSEDPGATFGWDGQVGNIAVSGGTLSALSGTGLVRVATFTPNAGVNDGVGSITVAAGAYADAAGNGGMAGSAPLLHFDTLAPGAPSVPALDPGSDSGAPGDGVTANATPLITGTAAPYNRVTLYDSDGVTVLGNAIADADGAWRIASSTLRDGDHTLSARQVDAAGNVSAAGAQLALTVDSAAPANLAAPRLATASDSGILGDGVTKVATPTFTGSAEPLAQVTLYDSDGATVLGTAAAGADGSWSITAIPLTEGVHLVSARQVDGAGNVSSAGAAFELTIDGTAPGAPAAPTLKASSDTGTPGDGITQNANPIFEGSAEAHAVVTLRDTVTGQTLGTAIADGDGKWSIPTTALTVGTHAISVTQADAAGNVSVASPIFNVRIDAPPATTPPDTLIDGVHVVTQTVTLPGGASGTAVQIPIVTTDRAETSGQAGVADIPLATDGSARLLLAQLPAGYGLSASGANVAVADGLNHLISAIVAATPGHDAADQGHLTGNGKGYLATLATQDSLLVETVTPVSTAAASGTLTLSAADARAGQNVALVIDADGVAPGTTLALQQVNFAAVIGAANVVARDGATVLSGDAAAQHFTVATTGSGMVFAGGGNDILSFGAPASPATAASAAMDAAGQVHADAVPAKGITLLHGGQGTDAATFNGARADFIVESHNGYLEVSSKAAPDDKALVVNVEQLQFSDGSVMVQNAADLTTVAGLYQTVLGRQADLKGFSFWADMHQSGASWGAMALDMIGSSERMATTSGGLNGNAAHDVETLYQALFNRASDPGAVAYWTDQMTHGVSLEAVATAMVQSAEMVGHQRAATEWDFIV